MLLLFLLYVIHNALIAYVAFGFLLPKKYLIYYVFFWPIMFLQWKVNGDRCFITEWEDKLNNDNNDRTVYENFSEILHMSPEHTEWFFIICTTFLWSIAIIRLLL
jgi:hypothetical protein